MTKEAEVTEFVAVTPPPKTRRGSGPKLSLEDCQSVFDQLGVQGEDGEYPWISNGIQYSSVYKAQAQALRYREAFAHYELVEDVKGTTSTVYSVNRDPETGAKKIGSDGKEVGPFIFALRIKTD